MQAPLPFGPFPPPPAAEALANGLVSKTDLLRLKAIARYHACGLPPEVDWSDLLQEAFARVLAGTRLHSPDVPFIAFVAGVMRSIKTEYWRRISREAAERRQLLARHGRADSIELDSAPNPERELLALEQLAAIEALFADDPEATTIIVGLAEGLTPEEIRTNYEMTKTEYDSTRRRMRRALLREGLRTRV